MYFVSKVLDSFGSGEFVDEFGDVASLGLGGEFVVELVRSGYVFGMFVVGRYVEGVGLEVFGFFVFVRR